MLSNGAIALLQSTRRLGLYSSVTARASHVLLAAYSQASNVRSRLRQVERITRATDRVTDGHGRGTVSSRVSGKRKDRRNFPKRGSRNEASSTAESDVNRGESVKRLLQPHALSGRLRKMCDDGQLDQAVSTLKNAPLDAQNTPVWNTLIWECMKTSRFKLAHQLFTDMKRRGFSPTSRTYQTMFNGLARIEHWATYPKQLSHAHSLYNYFRKHIQSVKEHDPDSPELTTRPLNAYIKILGDAGHFQTIFDVYYSLDQQGPFAADRFFYTAIFDALAKAKAPLQGGEGTQGASHANLIWQQMMKASSRSGTSFIDSYVIASAVKALSTGRLSDQTFALTIVREYLLLVPPGEEGTRQPSELLTSHTLDAALSLCNVMRNYTLCIHFARQVMDRRVKSGEVSIIDRLHVEHVLRAHASLASEGSQQQESRRALDLLKWMLAEEISERNGPKIRPATSTFNLVLMACWRGVDWDSAARTFELMTGYSSVDFADEAGERRWRHPRLQRRSAGRNLVPDAEVMSCMVRAAIASRRQESMRQCLRIVNHWGADHLFGQSSVPSSSKDVVPVSSKKETKHKLFYRMKLADALKEAVDRVLAGPGKRDAQASEWQALRQAAVEMLSRPKVATETPMLEQSSDDDFGWGSQSPRRTSGESGHTGSLYPSKPRHR